MKMSGNRFIAATREEVWEKLNDPDVLQRCIPGCEKLEKKSDTEMSAVVAVKIGPMRARFNGNVELQNLNPPESYRISGSGQGGAAGAASGGADVRLVAADGGTELTYDVDATVRGKMAQLGARLIDATAASLANQFFDNFAKEVTGPEAEEEAQVEADAAKPATLPAGAGIPQWLWLVAAAAALIVIGLYAVMN